MEVLLEFFTKGLITMLMIAMPCVLTAATIGLIVGILQAVTQVQEQTIAAAPKIFTVFLVIILLGSMYMKMLENLFTEGAVIAFDVVPRQDNYVLPAGYYNYTKPFWDEMKKDTKSDMTPMSHILNGVAKPPQTAKTNKYNFLRNGATDVPTPNFVERKYIRENNRQ